MEDTDDANITQRIRAGRVKQMHDNETPSDKQGSISVKGKCCRTVVKTALFYGSESWDSQGGLGTEVAGSENAHAPVWVGYPEEIGLEMNPSKTEWGWQRIGTR